MVDINENKNFKALSIEQGLPARANVGQSSLTPVIPNRRNYNEEPFCSICMVFFFLGIFCSPLFLLIGIAGLWSDERHKYFAGKLSAITCAIICIVWLVSIVVAVIVFILFYQSFDTE